MTTISTSVLLQQGTLFPGGTVRCPFTVADFHKIAEKLASLKPNWHGVKNSSAKITVII